MEQLNKAEREVAINHVVQMQHRDKLDISVQHALADIGVKDLTFARLALSIPTDHYELLKLIYPDMVCPDGKIKTNFYTKRAPKIDLFKAYMINPEEQMRGKRNAR